MEVRASGRASADMFERMIDSLWEEWSSEYVRNGYETKTAMRDFYATVMERFYILQDDGKFVGCYGLHSGTISDVFVVKERRGIGLGRMLMEDAIRRSWYLPRIRLFCRDELVGFYEKFGFRQCSSDRTRNLMLRYNRAWIDAASAIALIATFYAIAAKVT